MDKELYYHHILPHFAKPFHRACQLRLIDKRSAEYLNACIFHMGTVDRLESVFYNCEELVFNRYFENNWRYMNVASDFAARILRTSKWDDRIFAIVPSKELICAAVIANRFDLLKDCCSADLTGVEFAIMKSNNIEMLKFVHSRARVKLSSFALASNWLEAIKWLVEQGSSISDSDMRFAINNHNIDIVKFLYTQFPDLSACQIQPGFDLDGLRWLLDRGCKFIVKFEHLHREEYVDSLVQLLGEGYTIIEIYTKYLRLTDLIQRLSGLSRLGSPIESKWMKKAIRKRDIEVIKWIHNHRDFDMRELAIMPNGTDNECIEYLRDVGYTVLDGCIKIVNL